MMFKMTLSSSISDIIACCILLFISVMGNAILIFCTWRCITRRLPTSFALIFSLAFTHVVKSIVINATNIVSSAGSFPNTLLCKTRTFTASMTTKLEIWFTLYLAVFYCVKLNRVVHPLRTPPNGKWRKHHLMAVVALWVVAIAVCCPYLMFGNNALSHTPLNESSLYEECKVCFPDNTVELFYHQLFMVIIDVLPLAILVLVCFRILLLFHEKKNATYGNIWIGHDPSETEVLRASKVIVLLMVIVTSLWISHYILVCLLKYIGSWYLISTVLALLLSGYSSLSPYLLMLINYKISLTIRSLRSFCCTDNKLSTNSQKSVPENPTTED